MSFRFSLKCFYERGIHSSHLFCFTSSRINWPLIHLHWLLRDKRHSQDLCKHLRWRSLPSTIIGRPSFRIFAGVSASRPACKFKHFIHISIVINRINNFCSCTILIIFIIMKIITFLFDKSIYLPLAFESHCFHGHA